MLSLSSSQTHPDLDAAFQIIENGGRKAKGLSFFFGYFIGSYALYQLAWLKDKRIGSKFAIPALYQPASLIPLEIWKSAPSTTNGNEQAHRNINRDGVNLTMLGGIMGECSTMHGRWRPLSYIPPKGSIHETRLLHTSGGCNAPSTDTVMHTVPVIAMY
jgi:hypothetical protein